MAIERPTFHESWYRVADIHPRLRSTVQISRQHFRGLPWHVIQDHTNNAFFRLAEPAYQFIGLLDGKRSVGDAWKIVNEHLGDDAPTQGEVIQLLGQLYMANLLQADVSADTHTLFARYKKRKQREVTGYLMNILFARLPLVDPDRFLNKWLPLLGWIFSPIGLVVWVILIGLGVNSILGRPGWQAELGSQASTLLSPQNLILLYVAFAAIKACHEMGHAISCKKFGKQGGTGGEVHVIGIMMLVFTPVPYVDASSSWALKNKWHRVIVGAAGMWVELAIASIAAMVWAHTSEATAMHAFAYNVMFVAGFSTIVFNANPLLRYDGYYMLSDILEIPNLAMRSKDYIFYLVKKYVWNVRNARNPAHGATEKIWMFLYAIASFIMRVFVSISIMFYLGTVLEGALIIVATAMAIVGILTWVLVPLGKFVHYLATNPELSRVRGRAIGSSVLTLGALVAALGLIPLPDRTRAEGVVEPVEMKELFARSEGFVKRLNVDGGGAAAEAKTGGAEARGWAMPEVKAGDIIMAADNRDLRKQQQQFIAEGKMLQVEYTEELADDAAKAQQVSVKLASNQANLDSVNKQLSDLELKAPLDGVLIVPDLEDKQSAFIKPSDRLGIVADPHKLMVRAALSNDLAGQLWEKQGDRLNPEISRRVEIRVNGRPDILLTGTITHVDEAGTTQLPAASLGYQVGGAINTAPDDKEGVKTVENIYQVRIENLQLLKAPLEVTRALPADGDLPLLIGQRVVVRMDLSRKPALVQAWTKFRQLFLKKFRL